MNLRDAMLCLDCDEIGLEATHCMLCGSRVVTPVARWLPPKDAARTIMKLEDIRGEAREMETRMSAMLAEVEGGSEPLGVGA